jgi:SulP family sulfate permease
VLLILASVSTIKPSEALSIWNTGWRSRLASVATFLSTLFLPIQAAVGFGVVLSALLYVNQSSTDISVVELVKRSDGSIEEREPPKRLASNKVTVLDVYGYLFYAGARTLERLLPKVNGVENPAVILRLRGHTNMGATLVEVLSNYADKLQCGPWTAVPHRNRRGSACPVDPHGQAESEWTGTDLRSDCRSR